MVFLFLNIFLCIWNGFKNASRHNNIIQMLKREKYESSLDLESIQFSLLMNHPPKWLIISIFIQYFTLGENNNN